MAPDVRSALMGRVRGRDTAPELAVRRVAFGIGLRFRLHRRDLPGTPDLVFPKHRVAMFVHGCFWHQHRGCNRAGIPKSRTAYWKNKLSGNVARDGVAAVKLRAAGWRVETIWECETKDRHSLEERIRLLFDLAVADTEDGEATGESYF